MIETPNTEPDTIDAALDHLDLIASLLGNEGKRVVAQTLQRDLTVLRRGVTDQAAEVRRLERELAAAKALEADPGCNDTTGAMLAQLAQQLAVLLQIQAQCATCAADMRQGARPDANFANLIIDGTGYCHAHADIANGRLVPKTGSGLFLGSGTMGR